MPERKQFPSATPHFHTAASTIALIDSAPFLPLASYAKAKQSTKRTFRLRPPATSTTARWKMQFQQSVRKLTSAGQSKKLPPHRQIATPRSEDAAGLATTKRVRRQCER